MRTAFFLFACSLIGCEATTSSPPPRTLDQPFTHAPARHASGVFWRPVVIRYQGDGPYRDVTIEPRTPSDMHLVDLRTFGDPGRPVTTARYLVPADQTVLRFWAREGDRLACREQLRITATSVGRVVEIAERRTDATCEILLLLTPIADEMPPPTPTGRGMWGTSSGPPVDPLDQTLP